MPLLLEIAQEWSFPTATSLMFESPVTCTGVSRLVVVPSPSWPKELKPQQRTVPSEISAQLWLPPAAICVTSRQPKIWQLPLHTAVPDQ